MNEGQEASYRDRLMKRKADLLALEEADRASEQPVELDQPSIGRLSRMDALQAQQMAQETARRRRQQLQRIEGALRRLEQGEFGYCALCEEPIDPRRLATDPTLTRCLDCVDG